ncbi:hypothetical protein Bca4012_082934 [Brassica carinata]
MAHPKDPHYLSYFTNECSFCKKMINEKKEDVYIYNESPFCSEECRENQLKADKKKKKKMKEEKLKGKEVESGPVTFHITPSS